MTIRILEGDCREVLRTLPAESVHCCVTSPPYYGLRDYGVDGQIGLEETPEQFIAQLVVVFREVRRVLRDDGTLWLNIGDSYAGYHGNKNAAYCDAPSNKGGYFENQRASTVGLSGLKQKDLIGIPWMLAFALRADGWYLRQDIIWHKPNPMPESVRDRCTKAHEYLFLLTKSARYYFDADAIKEPVTATTVARLSQNVDAQVGSDRVPGKTNGAMKAVRSKANSFKREGSKREQAIPGQTVGTHRPDRVESEYDLDTRNKRSVWTIATQPFKQAHFATFPPALVEPCILAGSKPGDLVLDPFAGSGTTLVAAKAEGFNAIGIERETEYVEIIKARVGA